MNMAIHPGGRRAGYGTVLALIVVFVAVPGLRHITIDNRLERWVNSDGEGAQRYDAFKEVFGNDEFALIAYDGADVFSEAALDVQLQVLDTLEAMPMVSRIQSVPTVYRDTFGAEEPEALKRDFLETPFYKHFLVSDAGDMATYFALIEPTDALDARTTLVRDLKEAAEPLQDEGFDVYFAGPSVLSAAMDETSTNEARTTFPIAFTIAIVMLTFVLRSIRAASVAVICATLSTAATVGIMGHLRVPLNMVTSVLPVLLWVLSLANSIHIIRRFQREAAAQSDARSALGVTLKAAVLPCTLSSLTTAAGFLSLVVATLAPVRELGFFAAIGFVLSLLISLTLGPVLILLFKVTKRTKQTHGLPAQIATLLRSLERRPQLVLAIAVLLTVLAALCIPFIVVESNPLTYFDNDSEVVATYDHIGGTLTGMSTVEIVLETPDGWLMPEVWGHLDRMGTVISELPGVTRVLSPLDILKKTNQWDHEFAIEAYALPETTEAAQLLLNELGEGERDFVKQLVTDDERTVRLTVLCHAMDNSGLLHILDVAESEIDALPNSFEGYVTGLVPHLVASQIELVDTQIRSFTVAFLVVFGCILFGLRSLSLTLLSIPPNVLPILCAMSTMALAHIYLDVGTVMMASVALGIAVDDTVHMLTEYRRQRLAGRPVDEAWRVTIDVVGPALLVTTLTACAGFATLSFSGFIPLQYFGFLAFLATAAAFVADVVFLPALATVVLGRTKSRL